MRSLRVAVVLSVAATGALLAQGRGAGQGQPAPPPLNLPADTPQLTALKQEAVAAVDAMKDLSQQMNDEVFSFGELGFQEIETHKYLVDLLRKNGFHVDEGVAGIP